MHIELNLPGRTVGFDLDFDPASIADVSTKFLFENLGSCEPEVMHVMNAALHPGDTAVDVGANIGVFTVLMAKLVGPTGHIVSFEPGPNNTAKLNANVALNKLENVETYEVPLWHTAEEVTLHLCADSGLNSLRPSDDTMSRVSQWSRTLDSYFHVATPRLIKIDAEGAEHHILAGAASLLDRHVPYVLCELNEAALARFDASQQSLRALMRGYHYDMWFIRPDGALPVFVPEGTTVVAARENTNVLFSTPEAVSELWRKVILT